MAGSRDLKDLLKTMQQMYITGSLKHYSNEWSPLQQTMQESPDSKQYKGAPDGMVEIPHVKAYRFLSAGVEIECGCDPNDDPVGVCCSFKCAQFQLPSAECQCPFWGEDSRGVDVQFP